MKNSSHQGSNFVASEKQTERRPVIAEILYSFKLGGSERLGALLARQFRSRGYHVVVASMYDASGPVQDELDADGIPALGYDYTGRSRWKRWGLHG